MNLNQIMISALRQILFTDFFFPLSSCIVNEYAKSVKGGEADLHNERFAFELDRNALFNFLLRSVFRRQIFSA
jgi:hypothetical protein